MVDSAFLRDTPAWIASQRTRRNKQPNATWFVQVRAIDCSTPEDMQRRGVVVERWRERRPAEPSGVAYRHTQEFETDSIWNPRFSPAVSLDAPGWFATALEPSL